MAEKKNWLLETGCPKTTYDDAMKSPLYAQIWEDYNAGVDLAEKYKGLAKRLDNPFPEQLHTIQMYKDPAVKVKEADPDGTIEIEGDNEPLAITLFWLYWHRSKKTHFDTKHGKAVPKAVRDGLAKYWDDQKSQHSSERSVSADGRPLGLIRVNG